MRISYQQAREAAARAVAERGARYTDRSDWNQYYRHGKPDCMVGYMLHLMGGRTLRGVRNNLSVKALMKWSLYWPSPEALFFLRRIQHYNDNFYTWAKCYELATRETLTEYPWLKKVTPLHKESNNADFAAASA